MFDAHTAVRAKLTAYIYQREVKNLNPEDAWKAAESATFNYAQVTPLIRKLRTSIWGMPFITFTYKATDLCGDIVGAGMSPQNSRARILNAPTTAATKGTVYWDSAGVLQLWDCNETLAQYNCPEEGDALP